MEPRRVSPWTNPVKLGGLVPIEPAIMKPTLRLKLLAGFSAVLAVFFASLFALHAMSSLSAHSETLAQRSVREMRAVATAGKAIEKYRSVQSGLAMPAPPPVVSDRVQMLPFMANAVDSSLAAYGRFELTAGERAAWQEVKGQWEEYRSRTADVAALASAGKTAQVGALMTSTRPLIVPLSDQVDKWAQATQANADATGGKASDAYGDGRNALLVLFVLGLAIGGAVTFLLARNIAGRASQMLHAAEGIADGELDQQVDVSGRDELAGTARAFTRMVDRLRELAQAARRIAAGDLTVEVQPTSQHDEFGNAFAAMVTDLVRLWAASRARRPA